MKCELSILIACFFGILGTYGIMSLISDYHPDDSAFITLVRDNHRLRETVADLKFDYNASQSWVRDLLIQNTSGALLDDSLRKALAKCQSSHRDTVFVVFPMGNYPPPVPMPTFTPDLKLPNGADMDGDGEIDIIW